MEKLKNKEHIVACILAIIHFSLWYYFSYVKFREIEVKNYNYILGLPEWFFYGGVVTSIIVIIFVIILVNILFKGEEKDANN